MSQQVITPEQSYGGSAINGKTEGTTRNLRVIVIGIGGVSCSGKTTLAKHIRNCLPSNSLLLFQDDFAPPEEMIPMHPEHNIKDWDDPEGAIDWEKMSKELLYVKANGRTSNSHYSHDHLNVQKPVPVDQATVEAWKKKFSDLAEAFAVRGEDLTWVVVDGFLLYWDSRVYNELGLKVLLRVPEPVGRARREERRTYFTAEGGFWEDPPNYWQNIVWPAYKKAHAGLFVGGDAEHDTDLSEKIPDLLVFNATEHSMTQLLDDVCENVFQLTKKALEDSETP